jgi:hypothetical protein
MRACGGRGRRRLTTSTRAGPQIPASVVWASWDLKTRGFAPLSEGFDSAPHLNFARRLIKVQAPLDWTKAAACDPIARA